MLGLIPFTLYYVIQRGWYAMENTRTPFLFAVFMNAVFIVLSFVFFNMVNPGAAQVTGLAVAFSAANWAMFLVAWPAIRRSYGFVDAKATLWALVRIALAAVVALAATIGAFALGLPSFTLGESKPMAFVDLALTSLVVLVVFVVAAWLFRVTELRDLLAWASKKMPIRLGS